MPIQITIEFADLQTMISERDQLKARIQELEAAPLRFSLEAMANVIAFGSPNGGIEPAVISLTHDQRKRLFDAIKQFRP